MAQDQGNAAKRHKDQPQTNEQRQPQKAQPVRAHKRIVKPGKKALAHIAPKAAQPHHPVKKVMPRKNNAPRDQKPGNDRTERNHRPQ
jgi:hypothetical protein